LSSRQDNASISGGNYMKNKKNIPESVRQRLLNRSKKDKRPFNELLQYYAMERFLYRLSISNHAKRFILKGVVNQFRISLRVNIQGMYQSYVL